MQCREDDPPRERILTSDNIWWPEFSQPPTVLQHEKLQEIGEQKREFASR